MSQEEQFAAYVRHNIEGMAQDAELKELTNAWLRSAIRHNYAQNFTWLGRPVIQVPQDVYALQELIWQVRPDLIIETGIAHGGSLVLSASMLALIDYCEAAETGAVLDPRSSRRKVVGVDIDIRPHNRAGIEAHPLKHLIRTIQGSSIDPEVIEQVQGHCQGHQRILVCLDSNHTHDHVLAELEAYAPLTSPGSYCVVWDTGVEDLPEGFCQDRPWGKGNNPKTAVWEYLRRIEDEGRRACDGLPLRFETDRVIENKLQITASPDGFLRRVAA